MLCLFVFPLYTPHISENAHMYINIYYSIYKYTYTRLYEPLCIYLFVVVCSLSAVVVNAFHNISAQY